MTTGDAPLRFHVTFVSLVTFGGNREQARRLSSGTIRKEPAFGHTRA
jgi:hypothetical protein